MKKLLRKLLWFIVKVVIAIFSLSILWVLAYKYVSPPITGMMLFKYLNEKEYQYQYDWVDLDQISSQLPLAFIASEDQTFMSHNGFDVKAIKGAIKHNKNSKRKRGASTISQQLAKNVFLFPTKSFFRKGLEAYFTLLVELIWGKERIMEVYVNVVELGNGIFGAEAAAQKYFKKSAKKLTKSEAALMASVLPNPIHLKIAHPTNYLRGRQAWTLRQMSNLGGTSIIKDWYE
jgi:monofunctional biosynthetic peptidoglycan transglycosylase